MLSQVDAEGGGKGLEGGTLKDSRELKGRLKMVKRGKMEVMRRERSSMSQFREILIFSKKPMKFQIILSRIMPTTTKK